MLVITTSILGTIGWLLAIEFIFKSRRLQKSLEAANKVTHSTPIKELAASFRDFVEGIDGKVAPEIEAAIKKLEAESTKSLPAHEQKEPKDGPPVMFKQKWFVKNKPVMNDTIWNLFVRDYNVEYSCSSQCKVIKRWGEKYKYTLEQQQQLINQIVYYGDRDEFRKYFDKHHNK